MKFINGGSKHSYMHHSLSKTIVFNRHKVHIGLIV